MININSINEVLPYKKQSRNARAFHRTSVNSWFVDFEVMQYLRLLFYLSIIKLRLLFYLPIIINCDIVLVATSNQI